MLQNTLFDTLPRPFLALAPMDDVTDVVFRQIVADCAAPDLFYTEFVNVDGLQSAGREQLLRKVRMASSEGSLVIQLWGLVPENFTKTCREIASGSLARELGLPAHVNFVGVDLNMGCPAKSEVQNGTCSALINNRPLAQEIINASKDGLTGRLPLSVKTRVGFNEIDMTWISFLLKQKLQLLTIHGRTRKQMSKVPANWDLIGTARGLRDRLGAQTLIVGNGDVESYQQALQLAQQYGLDGIMIGRGIFHDPFAFSEDSPWQDYTPQQKIDLFRKHVALFADTWQPGTRNIKTLNRFCKVYINGFDGAKELREQLMLAYSTDELLKLLQSAYVKNLADALVY
jgi:tRNA-dihydrouridine synthase